MLLLQRALLLSILVLSLLYHNPLCDVGFPCETVAVRGQKYISFCHLLLARTSASSQSTLNAQWQEVNKCVNKQPISYRCENSETWRSVCSIIMHRDVKIIKIYIAMGMLKFLLAKDCILENYIWKGGRCGAAATH